MRKWPSIPAITVLLALAGCLQAQTTHTLYLSPDGGIAWTAEEKEVYSDQADPLSRRAEEDDYLAAATSGTHDVALGLLALGPDGAVTTRVLRDERPFHVVTEARFHGVEHALQRLFDENGIRTTASVRREGDETALRVTFDFSEGLDPRDGPASALLDKFERFRFVLTEGEFLSAEGFDLSEARVATPSKRWLEQSEEAYGARAGVDLALTWKR